MDRESPELIEQQMEQTRESLTEKVSQLEQQVVDRIQSATDAVQETVQSVRSAVEDTVSSVTGTVKDGVESMSEGVKEAMDVRKHVREHPIPMVCGATAVGFITGMLLFGRKSSAVAAPAFTPTPFAGAPAAYAAAPRPAWLNDLFELAGREVKKVAERVIARASSSLQEGVEQGIPKLIDRALPDVTGANGRRGQGNVAYPDLRR